MRALVNGKGKNEFTIENRDIPSISKHELLIKVDHCGICGSDLHAASNAKGYEFVPKPIVLGHEFSGTVAKAGSDQFNELLGRRVIIFPSENCGECEQCLSDRKNICSHISGIGLHKDGGMAEYAKVQVDQVVLTPDALPSEIAALTEPLSVAVHAVERVGSKLNGKKVLVQGCGIIGMFTALVAKTKGADVTISGLEQDVEHRLSLAEEIDIKTEVFRGTIDTSHKFDYVFECSGSSVATTGAVSRIKKGGALILVALYENEVELPVNLLVRGEIDVQSSYASVIEDFHRSIEILNNNKESFRKFIRIYPLNEGEQAFADARNQKVLKPILEM